MLNEHGHVLSFQIVLNDTRDYLREHLSSIWNTKGRTVITQAVYTDNPKVNERIIKEAFGTLSLHDNHSLHVLLV